VPAPAGLHLQGICRRPPPIRRDADARPFAAYAADLQQNAPGSGSASGGLSRYIRCSADFAAPEPENHLTPLFYLVFLIDVIAVETAK
jgi:hypothetical protein